VVLGVIVLVVDSVDEGGSGLIRSGSGDDDLLASTLHVLQGIGALGEDTGGLADVLDARLGPRNLLRVLGSVDVDLASVNDELSVAGLDSSLVLAVDRVVLHEVDHVVQGHKGIVDRLDGLCEGTQMSEPADQGV